MKVAVVHDWLNTKDGGAEMVLRDILSIYPEADLFTLLLDKERFRDIVVSHNVIPSGLQKLPHFVRARQHLLLPFIRRAIGKIDLTGYDFVITSSGAWSKNVTIPQGTTHVCYCYTPARMLWDSWPSYAYTRLGNALKIPFVKVWLVRLMSKLRLWDYYQTKSINTFLCDSNYVAERIKKFYQRDAEVVYPGIDISEFNTTPTSLKSKHYIVVSSLAEYKNIELAIDACGGMNKRLVIAGSGPHEQKLRDYAAKYQTVQFVGRVSEEEKRILLAEAHGLLFTNIEDFGITPIEAAALGTPTIALDGGGARETIVENVSGMFFAQPTQAALKSTLHEFEQRSWDRDAIRKSVRQFDKKVFIRKFKEVVDETIR